MATLSARRVGTRHDGAVIHEAALRCQVGSPAIMRAQWTRLLEIAALPNVVLQVLPNDAGAHPGSAGTFSILEFPDPGEPALAYVETMTGNLFVESDSEVHRYAQAFGRLCAMALRPGDSTTFLARLAGQAAGPAG